MNLVNCPVCKSPVDLAAIIADEDARELARLTLELDRELARALIQYVGLFRPEKSKLSNGRTLSLIKEVMALCDDVPVLTAALTQTSEQIIEQRQRQGWSKMSSHGYLHKVLQTEAKKVKPEYVYVNRQQAMGFVQGKSTIEIKGGITETREENARRYKAQMDALKKRTRQEKQR